MKPVTYLTITAALAITAGVALPVSAQDSAAKAVRLDEVVTIGTRATKRTATSSAVPVDVISSQLLESTGLVETWQQLQRLVPSVFGPHIPLGDPGTRPITLRGLPPHHTLVLVNGKRRHASAALLGPNPSVPNAGFTDLNTIPASAIDRIEVLRDGASAQYGSDAIGGVVNIVLKSGPRRDLRVTAGEVSTSEGGRTFHDGRTLNADGSFGLLTKSGARLTLAGELRDRNGTNRAYPDARQQYFVGDPRNNNPPRISSYFGEGDVEAASVFLNAAFPLRSVELYAFGGGARKSNIAPDAMFRRPLDDATVRAIYPDGFLPSVDSRTRDASGVAGIRGTLREWRWDLSSGLGANSVAYYVDNSNNASLGGDSPASFYSGRIAAQQWTTNLDASRELSLRRMPLTLAGGVELRLSRYQMHAGDPDSWRDGKVTIADGPQANRPAPVGAQGFPGFRPDDEVSAQRSNVAAYVEADIRPLKRLLVQSAARAERYSDFGSTSDGKVAGRIDLIKGAAIRGSVSTGFRAPSLNEQYSASTRTVFTQSGGVGTFLLSRTFPVNAEAARLIGATELRPETSLNRSIGIVLSRARLPVITADYYDIEIDDRIVLAGVVSDSSLIRLFAENGLSGIAGGSYFANKIDTRTSGVDVIASHRFLLGNAGSLQVDGGYNHNKPRVTSVAPAPAPLARFETRLFGRMGEGILERGQPRQTITLGLNYNRGPLGLNVRNQKSGPTAQLDGQARPEFDQIVSAKWVTDVRASYRLKSGWQVALSAANLFDVYPNDWNDFKDGVQATGFSNRGIFRYPAALSAIGLNGRTLYVQLSYR